MVGKKGWGRMAAEFTSHLLETTMSFRVRYFLCSSRLTVGDVHRGREVSDEIQTDVVTVISPY